MIGRAVADRHPADAGPCPFHFGKSLGVRA
jgi:hypothetical protein